MDFLKEYKESDITRLHMPGHKGKGVDCLPDELKYAYAFDITEIGGADNLFQTSGIIKESEDNASDIFGIKTFYSTEGSSLSIKAMVYIAQKHYELNNPPVPFGERPYIITAGMCHKALFHAVELLNVGIERVEISLDANGNVSGTENESADAGKKESIKDIISKVSDIVLEKGFLPIGFFTTYPDYFGNVCDLSELKKGLSVLNIPLLTDGAHSSYLKFLDTDKYSEYKFPGDCGADIFASSAHKTLPALTGTAYLHISDSFKDIFPIVKHALDLFGSSSPSYLLMASLDAFNAEAEDYRDALSEFIPKAENLKKVIEELGFNVRKSDPLRIVVWKDDTYSGEDFTSALRENKCEPECFDDEYVIMMLTPFNDDKDLQRIKEAFTSLKDNGIKEKAKEGYNCLDNFI